MYMEKQDEVKEKKSTSFSMPPNEDSHNVKNIRLLETLAENASFKSTNPYLVPERKLPIFPISAAGSNFNSPEED